MAGFDFAGGAGGTLAAWEAKGQVYCSKIDPKNPSKSSTPMEPPGGPSNRKYPVACANAKGQVLLAWFEKGKEVQWQAFDEKGKPLGESGKGQPLADSSRIAVFTARDGSFRVLH